MLKKYINNTSWLFIEKIFRILTTLLTTVLMARYLGPNDFGLLNYAISFVTLFAVLSSLGFEKLLPKLIIDNKENTNIILGSSFLLKIIGSILIMIICYLSIIVFKGNEQILISLVIILSFTFIFKSFEIIRFWFETNVEAKYSAKVEFIAIMLSTIIKLLLIFKSANLIYFAYAILIESMLIAIGLIIIYSLKDKSLKSWKISKKEIKNILKDAWPLILAGALYTIYTKIDQIMIGELIGNSAVGIYAAAIKLSEGWFFIPSVLAISFFPAMLNARKKSYEIYIERTQNLLNIMALISIVVSILTLFIANYLIYYTYGEEYKDAALILLIHIWGGIFVSMSTISYRYFIIEGLQKLSFYRGLTGLIINIILNFILIPKYGIEGAAYATVISQICALYFFNFFNKKTRLMFFMQTKALILFGIFSTLKDIKKIRNKNV